MSGIEFFTGNDGRHYFRIKASNGRTVAVSEGYKEQRSARKGAAALVKAVKALPDKEET